VQRQISQIPAIQITCINKPNRNSDHEAIENLGRGVEKWPQQTVVTAIDYRTHRFYTLVNGVRAWLETRQGRYRRYVQTVADKKWQNNLLHLPECP